ncbi:hypothetical protein O977_07170 [Mycobacterium avium subsp. paratuberculosis 10-5975]|nr:hypothetical protein O977_07170 [Mycobacterium avium subsp. paratuberculosis 10-5975]
MAQPEEESTQRRRHRAAAKQLGRGYEYLDPEPSTTASQLGAPTLGFAGTAAKRAAAAPAGLSAPVLDEFADAPRAPMMPATWMDRNSNVHNAIGVHQSKVSRSARPPRTAAGRRENPGAVT